MSVFPPRVQRWGALALLLAPALATMALLIAYPFVQGLYYAFTDWNGITRNELFVGLDNFVEAVHDEIFLRSIVNTLVYTVVVIVVQHVVSLGLAVLVDKKVRGAAFFNAVLFVPSLLSTVVIGILFSILLSPFDGPVNQLWGLVDDRAVNWLGDPSIALVSVALVTVWQWLGYSMLIYVAGLQGVGKELIESATIDGAGPWIQFWKIEFPALAPAFTINIILSLIGCLKTFEQVLVLTGGGPGNTTEVIGTYIYSAGFTAGRFGYGTAVSLFLFLGIVVLSFVQLKFLQKREEDFT